MLTQRTQVKNLLVMRFNPGDDLLEKMREAVEREHVRNAVILSGVGSVTSHHFHVVASAVNPPEEDFSRGEKPADIVNIDGFVINGRVHAHIIFSDKDTAYGGHLEPGVRVLTFAVLSMAEVDLDFDQFDSIGDIEALLKK
jgi:predicted DNA-binding protein with PD1-like motif